MSKLLQNSAVSRPGNARYRFTALLCLWCLLGALPSAAQQASAAEVRGVVTNLSSKPVAGVAVTVNGAQSGAVTDAQGRYAVKIKDGKNVLAFSCLGYESQQFEVSAARTLNVILKEAATEIDQVVVIGYGTMRKRDVTGAIQSISEKSIEERIPVNIFDAMQGQVAGVEVVTGSGAPGEGAEVKIRGASTFEGGAKPLYVVDGVPMDDIDVLNPADIQSIEILKDAASAAIYGSRSANGVIIVSTKQGEKSNPRLDIRYLNSYSQLTRQMPKANADERRYYDRERRRISGGLLGYNPVDTLAFFNNQDMNLQDLLFRTAVRNQVDLSASGASDRFKYYLSAGYLGDKGIIVNSKYDRITSRINTEYIPSKTVTLGSKIQFSYAQTNGISEDGVLNQLLQRVPYWAIFNPDGSYVPNLSSRRNPYAVAMDDTNIKQTYKASAFEYVKLNLGKKFEANLTLQGNFTGNDESFFRSTPQLSESERSTGRDYFDIAYNWANENYVSYTDKFCGTHELTAMVGNSIQYWNLKDLRLWGYDYTTDNIYTLNTASTFDASRTYTRITRHSMASFFGRVAYNYKGKYLLNGNLRYDGSSRFGSDNKWGAFPSASAGWRFSDEKFTRWMKRVVSDGKLRLSYGVTGNQEIGDYDSWQLYSPNYIYEGVAGIAASQIAFSDLSWEQTTQYDAGIDLSMIGNRLRVTADYYWKDTDRLLSRVEMPKETGYNSVRKNVGAMTNEGFEFSIDYDIIRRAGLKWNVGFNIAHNDSRVTRIADGIPFYKGLDDAIYVQQGARLGEFYGYKYKGIFAYDESNAFTEDWKRLTPVFSGGVFQNAYYLGNEEYTGTVYQKKSADGVSLKGGDVDYEDLDGNGITNSADKQLIGCAQPDVFGGLSTSLTWKGLGVYISLYYSFGGDIYNYAEARRNMFSWDGATPSPEAIARMWTNPGDNALYPAPINKEHNRLPPSSFYIEDGSYIKLRNVKISYNLPTKWVKKVAMRSAQVYVYGNNLLTWTDYKGYDPEFSLGTSDPLTLGIDQNRYPRKRELGFGINLGF